MKSLIVLINVVVLGCGGNVDMTAITDGSQDGGIPGTISPEQQLRNSLASWCAQVCSKLTQCPALHGYPNCEGECSDSISNEFLGRGDTCAKAGLDFMACLIGASCSDLDNNPNVCDIDAALSACSSPNAVDAGPPNTSSTAATVACRSSAGSASTGITAVGSVVCENFASDCSDGHTYSFACTSTASGLNSCVCYVDGQMGNTFSASGVACPDVDLVNTACGWHLLYI
jgi:hypothetical protein